MKIYLAADHGGFEFKKQLLTSLEKEGYELIDCGNTVLDPNDDYPDFVRQLANKMFMDQKSMGIVLCRNGVGVSIAANRHSHLRCGLGLNESHVKSARTDDNINVLSIASDYLDFAQVEKIVKVFLETPYSNLDRHNRRLAKIDSYRTSA